MRFPFIAAEKAHHAVSLLCRCLRVTRSGFYAWQRRPESAHARQDRRLKVARRKVPHQERGFSPRLGIAMDSIEEIDAGPARDQIRRVAVDDGASQCRHRRVGGQRLVVTICVLERARQSEKRAGTNVLFVALNQLAIRADRARQIFLPELEPLAFTPNLGRSSECHRRRAWPIEQRSAGAGRDSRSREADE
jgi:hypothetical protein